MKRIEFLKPRFCGTRFAGASIPLEVLADLAVLKEMLVEVAKYQYLQDHTDRKRSPRNFTDGIELQLVRIEEGSAVPVIVLGLSSASLFPSECQTYLERSRDLIISAISAAEHGQTVTSHLPERALVYFDRFGRSIGPDEAIEFDRGDDGPPARLTKASRQWLLGATTMDELTDNLSVRAQVLEFNDDAEKFELQLLDGKKLIGPAPVQFRDVLIEAMRERKQGVRVWIQGVGRFDRKLRPQGFATIDHVTRLDPLDVPMRLEELAQLQDGWLDGHGKAPTKVALTWFESVFDDALPLPFLYPTEEGGLRAEWEIDERHMSLDVDLERHIGAWHCWNSSEDSEEARELSLDSEDAWKLLADLIGGTGGHAP